MSVLLDVRDLTIDFAMRHQRVRAVDGATLAVGEREVVGVVGESGSGKTSLGLALTRLLPEPPAIICGGQALFEGEDLLCLSPKALTRVRGARIAYVFQEPSTSLNPVMTIGRQLREVLELHAGLRGASADARAVQALSHVGVPAPSDRLASYPHELSGGMKQRVMIAMAIACNPKLLIADEPTTALDVTIERQIIALLKRLQRELGLSLLVISHNIRLIAQLANRVAVMWQGRVVEDGPVERVLRVPQHEYTKRLLAAQPTLPHG